MSASKCGQWAVSEAEVRHIPSRPKHLKSGAWGLQASLPTPAMETLELHMLRDRAAGGSESPFCTKLPGKMLEPQQTLCEGTVNVGQPKVLKFVYRSMGE